jgi:hypothetical protein
MKHIKLFEGFLNEAENKSKLKFFMAGLTERGDDEWRWQGIVVAASRKDALSNMRDLLKGSKLIPVVDNEDSNEGEPAPKAVAGLYDSTDFGKVIDGKVKPVNAIAFKKAIAKFDQI